VTDGTVQSATGSGAMVATDKQKSIDVVLQWFPVMAAPSRRERQGSPKPLKSLNILYNQALEPAEVV
jgi:hypothetical protein